MTEYNALTDYEKRIIANVRDHGCHITYVFDPDGDEPAFAYSAGFPETVGQPEVIVFGLGHEIMHFMINEVHRQCRAGLTLVDAEELHGLLEGHRCVMRNVPTSAIQIEFFNSAMWLEHRRTGNEMTRAVQIVWPGSTDGLFPWDDGCEEAVRKFQPALYAESLNS